MTKSHALRQLLRLGPLTHRELVAVTGWPSRVVTNTCNHLHNRCEVVFVPGRHGNQDGEWSMIVNEKHCVSCAKWAPKSTPRHHTDAGHALCLQAKTVQPWNMLCGFRVPLPPVQAAARVQWLRVVQERQAQGEAARPAPELG